MTDVQFDPETGEVIEPAVLPMPKPRKRITKKKPPTSNGPRVPLDETKRQKFERLAEFRFGRIVRALHYMRGLGRNQGAYEYGEADVERLRTKLQAEVDEALGEMKRRGRPIQTKLFG
jgi:hypothetical protein